MKTFTKKILVSIFSLLFFFAIFGTVTYAWFSLSKFNQLSNLNIELITGNEFQISLDGINFSNEISSKDIEDYIGGEAMLSDITSFDGKSFEFGRLNEDKGVCPIANKDYLSFPLYFRTTRKQKHVYLVENVSDLVEYDMVQDGTYIVSRGINWRADCTFQNGPDPENDIIYAGQRRTLYAADAIRISFIEEIIEDNILDTRDQEELLKKIIDLTENPDRGYGVEYGGISYYNKKHKNKLTPPTKTPETVYELTEFDSNDRNTSLNRNSEIMEMIETTFQDESGDVLYIGKIQINIWIEGWDADCFNAIYRDSLRIQLKFRLGNPKTVPLEKTGY